MTTALMPRATIDEVIGLRSLALARANDAFSALAEAQDLLHRAAPSARIPMMGDTLHDLLKSCRPQKAEDFNASVQTLADRAIWEHIIGSMGIEKLMDAQAREAFRKDLMTNPPEVTADNVRATLESLMGDAGLIFRRGIANAFSRLDRRFRTHDAFKVGSKIIFRYAFSQYGSWCGRTDEYLRDVERTFHVLDGKEQPERYAGIIGAIDVERRKAGFDAAAFTAESDYFRVRAFKNGNLHVWFTRTDLIEQVNKLLAEHYGAVVGDNSDESRKASAARRRSNVPAKNFGFFPTPDALAKRVIENAYIKPGDRVLEPSAGTGALASRAKADGGLVTCVEVQPALATGLEGQGYQNVFNLDFLDTTPDLLGKFDRIVMNPPFDRGLDVDHVVHALDFLETGGTLVAIMAAGVEFRSDKKTVAFRDMITRLRGDFHDLPAGSFSEVGTEVNTVMLTVSRK